MTEKRFTLVDIGFVYDYDNLLGMKEIVDLLNALHEEVLYWKQVASQRGNEIEVMTHKLQMK